jgi:hypothetical protein
MKARETFIVSVSAGDPEWSGFVNGHALSVNGGWFADASWESLRRRKRGT